MAHFSTFDMVENGLAETYMHPVVPKSRLLLPVEFGEYITLIPPVPFKASGIHVIAVGWEYK